MTKIAILLAFLLSVVITYLLIPQLVKFSYKKRLFDKIDERKVHKVVVSRLGGVAFAPAIIMGVALAGGLAGTAGGAIPPLSTLYVGTI
jgi:UDP-N-acetylmuramyl pentapeptide phosphotransferase/UDP-N-acetylglucosamine-1-phosphate transferase